MIFNQTNLKGAFTLEIDKKGDDRGFFARIWDKDEFKLHGLNYNLEQSSISFNNKKGTLRGMHFQKEPCGEDKLIRVSNGSAFYVIIDLRRDSLTFKKYFGIILSETNYSMLYAPKGFASGFLTLEDNTEIIYQMSQPFVSKKASGVRWNDPAFNITWPQEVLVISDKDKSFSDFA